MYTQGDNLMFCNADHIPLLIANFNTQRRCWFFPPCLKPHELRRCMTPIQHEIVSLKMRVGKQGDCDLGRDETLMWHKLFGHCGMQGLWSFLKDRIGTSIGKHLNDTMDNGADCLIAKSKRWNELLSKKRPTEPMDIVASDIMGPFEQANINSGHWALTIRDIGSTYGECHIIVTKADAAAVSQGVIIR
ncbi:hypothetical protein O181_032397 [Austropuccinia psidii MF-1]|uniref:GAG-pre-integrase domain-containing protein n=1 Tax=Austropuccinia psidii MF-1 TaxID=1389203 RepID=A0A9Q3CZE0_9BASI|nr:hypothetical protein [Austropuccinia psidii MF-1]